MTYLSSSEARNRFECGQSIRAASISARSLCDSGRAGVHAEGGDKNGSQFQQNETDAGVGSSEVGFRGTTRWGHTLSGDAFCNVHTGDAEKACQRIRSHSMVHTYLFHRQPTQTLAKYPDHRSSPLCTSRVNMKLSPDPCVNAAGDPGETVGVSDELSCAGHLGTDEFGGG